ncbi:hypothetical protein Lal_00042154 [Lupinus albus]|nr:hypothetical protein Lal_00042054 [Lupinus albus]KAF1898366.1 hypothetical protein Lal_00042055 [Lupinus albus]KAF1898376.1 hypothetical protein Lal_00042067 [Lupinus albus]KAF1898398.1 hypothetical protein Lal_00042090 [Lupinus albus]KAF1898418.1 hypothetical protein Lal_00042110 [Lupinus albus]
MDRMGDSAPNAYIMRRIPTYGPKVTPRTDNYDLKHLIARTHAVKRAWARVVLGWVTSWEVLVLHLSLFPTPGAFPDSKQ